MTLLYLSIVFALLPLIAPSRKWLLFLELLVGIPILLLSWHAYGAIRNIPYLSYKLPNGAFILFAALFHVGLLVRFVGIYCETKTSRLKALMLELFGILMIAVVYASFAFGRYYQELGYLGEW